MCKGWITDSWCRYHMLGPAPVRPGRGTRMDDPGGPAGPDQLHRRGRGGPAHQDDPVRPGLCDQPDPYVYIHATVSTLHLPHRRCLRVVARLTCRSFLDRDRGRVLYLGLRRTHHATAHRVPVNSEDPSDSDSHIPPSCQSASVGQFRAGARGYIRR